MTAEADSFDCIITFLTTNIAPADAMDDATTSIWTANLAKETFNSVRDKIIRLAQPCEGSFTEWENQDSTLRALLSEVKKKKKENSLLSY